MLIGICGKMGSGKDWYTQNIIIPVLELYKKTYIPLALADQIKINVMTQKNIKYDELYVQKTAESRNLLQQLGTDEGRNVYGKDIWIKYHSNWTEIFEKKGINYIISPDIRFSNELLYVKERGGIIIKLVAPKRNEQRLLQESNGDYIIYNKLKNHISECELDNEKDESFDLIVNNEFDISQDIINMRKIFNEKLNLNKNE